MDDTARNIFNIIDSQYKKDMRIKVDRPKTEKFNNQSSIVNSINPKNDKGEIVGDFIITDEFGAKERIEKIAKKRKKDEKNKQRTYKLLAKKEFILKRLASMSLTKKKHIDEVAELNYKIEMIDWELKKIKEESGIDYLKIQHGSKIQQLMAYVAKKLKKIKKFFVRNWPTIQNFIIGIGSVVLPIIIGIFAGRRKPVAA